MVIDTLETVRLDGGPQWIRVRGTDPANPVLLLMQHGPGLPIINEVRRYERLLRLEEAFTVVYWDQRGTGLALRDRTAEVSTQRVVADTVALLDLLRNRFGGKVFVAGFSFGATYAAQAAARRPDLVAALVATGMDIDIPLAEQRAYDFALDTARRRGNRRAIRQLEKIGPPPHVTARRFATRARWMYDFGGIQTDTTYAGEVRRLLVSLLRSPDYPVADVVRTVRGVASTQAALLPELATTDLVRTLPRLDIPIVLAQGRLDRVAPGEAAQRYYDALTAPSKKLVWFEHSAHSPQFEEPAKFRDVLMDVRAAVLAAPA